MNRSGLTDTRILPPEKFEEILKVKNQMKKRQYLDYVMLKIAAGDDKAKLREQSVRLTGLVRENDVLGIGKDGNLYLLLSQTGKNDLSTVAKRLEDKGIMFEEVSGQE